MSINKLTLFLILFQFKIISQEVTIGSHRSIGETFHIKSSILEETREIYIYQPQGLWGMDEKMNNLPVIYVLDGESQFNHTATTVDFLSPAANGNDFIPRSIVVGIPNTNRNRDLTPKEDIKIEMSGGGTKFLGFIIDELIPYIDSTYNTSDHRTIIGHSLGGLITFEMLLRKREYFDNYIAIDPAFGFANESFLKEVIDSLDNSDLSTENIYFTAANNRPTFLAKEDLISDTSEFLKSIDIPNQKFIKASETNNWNVKLTTKYYPHENHFSIPHRSTYDGLRELYHFYTFPDITNYYHHRFKNKEDLVRKIRCHYRKISNIMGYEVLPMQGYINSFAYGLSHYNRKDLAIALLEYNIEMYPEEPIVYNNLGYFYMTNGYTEKAIELYSKSLQIKGDKWVEKIIIELKKYETEHNKRR